MGAPKPFLDWYGKPLLEWILEGFSGAGELLLSLRAPEQHGAFPELERVYDIYPGCGPLAGLQAGLRAARTETLFVTCCDLPLVDRRTAEVLLARLGTHDAAVPVTGEGRAQPLPAVYRTSAEPVAEALLRAGRLRLADLPTRLDTVLVSAQRLPLGEDTLANLNTPHDVEQLKTALRLRGN